MVDSVAVQVQLMAGTLSRLTGIAPLTLRCLCLSGYDAQGRSLKGYLCSWRTVGCDCGGTEMRFDGALRIMTSILMFPCSLIVGLLLIVVMLLGFLWGGNFSSQNLRGVLSWDDQLKKFDTKPFWTGGSWSNWLRPKLVHLVLFGSLGFLLVGSLGLYGYQWYVVAFSIPAVAGGILLGFATEYLQACFARGPSWWDVGLNVVSVLVGNLAAWVYLCMCRMTNSAE